MNQASFLIDAANLFVLYDYKKDMFAADMKDEVLKYEKNMNFDDDKLISENKIRRCVNCKVAAAGMCVVSKNSHCKRCAERCTLKIGGCRSSVDIFSPNSELEYSSTHKENGCFSEMYAIQSGSINAAEDIESGGFDAVSEAEIAEIVAATKQNNHNYLETHDDTEKEEANNASGSTSYEFEGYHTDLGHLTENESLEETFKSGCSSDDTPDPKVWYSHAANSKQRLRINTLHTIDRFKKHTKDMRQPDEKITVLKNNNEETEQKKCEQDAKEEYSFVMPDHVSKDGNKNLLNKIRDKIVSKLQVKEDPKLSNECVETRKDTNDNEINNTVSFYDITEKNTGSAKTSIDVKDLEEKFSRYLNENLESDDFAEGKKAKDDAYKEEQKEKLKKTFVDLLQSYTSIASSSGTIDTMKNESSPDKIPADKPIKKTVPVDKIPSYNICADMEQVHSNTKLDADRSLLLIDGNMVVASLKNRELEDKDVRFKIKQHNLKIVMKKRPHETVVNKQDDVPEDDNRTSCEDDTRVSDVSSNIRKLEVKIFNVDEYMNENNNRDVKTERLIVEKDENTADGRCVVIEANEPLNQNNNVEILADGPIVDVVEHKDVDKSTNVDISENKEMIKLEEVVDPKHAENGSNEQQGSAKADKEVDTRIDESSIHINDINRESSEADINKELVKILNQRCKTEYVDGMEIKSIEVPVTEKKIFSLYEPYHDYNFERLYYQFHIEECESLKEFGNANIIGKLHYRSESSFYNFNWVKLSERRLCCYKTEFSYVRKDESDLLSPSLNEKFHGLDLMINLDGAKLFLHNTPVFTLHSTIEFLKCKKLSDFIDITNFHIVNIVPKGSKYQVDISNDLVKKQFMIKDLSFMIVSDSSRYFFRSESLKAFANWLTCIYMRIHNFKGFV